MHLCGTTPNAVTNCDIDLPVTARYSQSSKRVGKNGSHGRPAGRVGKNGSHCRPAGPVLFVVQADGASCRSTESGGRQALFCLRLGLESSRRGAYPHREAVAPVMLRSV